MSTRSTTHPRRPHRPPISTFKAACLLAVAWGASVVTAHAAPSGPFSPGAGRVGVAALPAQADTAQRRKRSQPRRDPAESTRPNTLHIREKRRSKVAKKKVDKAAAAISAAGSAARESAKVFVAASPTETSTKAAAKTTKSKAKTNAAIDAAKTITVTTLSGTAAAASTVTATSTATVVSGTATATGTSAVSTSTAVPAGYTLPQPFDSTLGTNFTSTACPSFFATFLADPDFVGCTPFSLLLATSSAFFTAQQSPYSLLPYVMDASCSVNKTSCDGVMASYAQQIKLASTCGPDLAKRNPLVVQALAGFQNYDMMYKAGCLHNNQTDQYCFAEAAAQTTASELYFWYLPEGTGLPSGTVTSCESCTQNLMDIYAAYATNSTLLISQTYASARTLAVGDCGPTFAAYVAPVSAATILGAPSWAWMIGLGLIGWWTIG